MKKNLFLFLTIVLLASIMGCKKDELQPSGWDKFWHKESIIMGDLNDIHNNKILPKIDDIRTTLQQYVMWDTTLIQVHGPGGYTPTAEKGFQVWLTGYHRILMPDTANPEKGEFAVKIIQPYLDNRRDYAREKAFEKMWLCIPKDLYEQDGRFWEWFLSKVHEYLTVTLGGPDAWTDGTRQFWQEMEIYNLPTTPDPGDPWHCDCSAKIRITEWYKAYAEGPEDKSMTTQQWQKLDVQTRIRMTNQMVIAKIPDYEIKMAKFRKTQADLRYETITNAPVEKELIGVPSDYETKLVTVNGAEYYILQIPNIPTR